MPPPKHQRARKPKSKNGCVTCKMRHVRCDEEKPECKKCTESGRKCDGYKTASQTELRNEITQGLPQHPWRLSPDHRLVLLPGSREERQYVLLFNGQATRALSGFFPSNYWSQYIPQLSHHCPTIRHAVAAVGAVYERQINGLLLPATETDPGAAEHFELQQYNKAIQGFVEQLASPEKPGISMILTTCLLFICVEVLRTNNGRALNHVQGGLQILARHLQDGKPIVKNDSDRELVHLFYRLNLQGSFFGRGLLQLDLPIEKSTSMGVANKLVFDHISQARECLTSLANRAFSFIRKVSYPPLTPSEVKDQHRQLDQHQTGQLQLDQPRLVLEFCLWETAFESMKTRSAKRVGISDPRAPLALQIEYHTMSIWLKCCLSRGQLFYDRFFPEFESIVSAAEKIIDLGTGPDVTDFPSQFSLDAEVIPALYWTASHCRDSRIRRRAIEATRNYPTREGMWHKRRYVEAATKIMEFEEAHCSFLPVEERIPEECYRIHDALMFSEEAFYTNPCPVMFLWKPHGLDADFEKYWDEVQW
ncbi:hypothetical protein N7492_004438 [Penicillium capsulatum]|uniref:Zn(2)-C6 fungal-type domain-containing protein n=1 Tax=Penicillium capsulatum TaxID=69766 RepID=A0A9W9IAF7_9EURO|nr:hypothetical protein N7492_004438 [Penicillium capsulatum]KAJ6136442.1 hypothetical protein N7512_001602 [Penicillium capsulatum]